LLHTEQWAAWSCHLQLLQHSLKCLMYNDISKECHMCVWQLIQLQKSTHLTLNQNCIDVQQLMSSHLIQCDTAVQTEHSHSSKNDIVWEKWVYWVLLLINKENWINISSHKKETTYAL
jgi:hypothetical protein